MSIIDLSLTQLIEEVKKKTLTSKEVVKEYAKRSEEQQPKINAYVTLEKKPTIPSTGVLSGLPLAIKDNFCTKGIRTTASSQVLKNFVPPYESTVTQKLHDAGYTMLGKTNMDAWAHGSSTETSDFGPTKNPWDTSRAPGGSSGGSAAAVSAGLAPAAIGSETAGSIRQPASWCGVVGLKPTYGRVSRYGVIAMGSSFDCPGPLTMTVEDSAFLLELIAGHDPYDATTSDKPVEQYRKKMKEKKNYTIGISDTYFEGVDQEITDAVMKSIKLLEKKGHTVKKIETMSPKYALSVYTILQRAEVSSNLARYDGVRYGNDRTAFGTEAKKRIMLGTYTLSHGFYDAYYKKAQKVRTHVIQDFQRVFSEVDFLISSPTPITALKLGEFEKYPFFGELMDILNEPASVAGIPAISVPCGRDKKGLPIGLQIVGNYFSEADILTLAYQFEQETKFFDIITQGRKTHSSS